MKKWFNSLLTEEVGNISIGSFCMLIFVIVYIGLLVASFCVGHPMPVSGTEAAGLIGIIYACKKIPQIWTGKPEERK